MHATVRRLKTQPGKAGEVAELIRAEYVPLLDSVDGFVSYTLLGLADDEISSVGVFESPAAAAEANDLARTWTTDRLGPYVAERLEAREAEVLVHAPNT